MPCAAGGGLVATSVRYWRGCKKLSPEDLELDPAHLSDRLIQLGHKRLIPRAALQAFALIESRVQATVESSSFPFLGGIEQSFPPAGDIAKRFAFETRLFQIAAPDSNRLEVAEGVAQLEAAEDRRRIADDATRRMQADLDAIIRESVASLREETAQLAGEVLATIDGSDNGVHQRTLNRLTRFIDNFRSLNFAGDQQLEQTLERFRRDLLSRTAEEYRNQTGAMAKLTDGLSRLRENAVQLGSKWHRRFSP